MGYFSRKQRLQRPNVLLGILAVGVFLTFPSLVLAAPGDLDVSFGNGGIVVTNGAGTSDVNYPYATPSCTPGAWTAAAPVPSTIAFYGFAQVGEDMYVIGGSSTGNYVRTTYKYNATTNTWIQLAPVPQGIPRYPAATVLDGKIYLASRVNSTAAFHIYDIAGESWTTGAPRPSLDSFGVAVGAFNGNVYVVGGGLEFDSITDSTSIYHVATNTWSIGPRAPVAFSGAGYTQVGQYLYVVGGRTSTGPNTNSIVSMRLDMSTNIWATGPVFMAGRADFALAAAGTKLVAMGGDEQGGTHYDSSAQVDELETSTWPAGEWTASPTNLPSPRQGNNAGFFSTSRAGGEIWSTGGYKVIEGVYTPLNEHLYRATNCGDPPPSHNGKIAFTSNRDGNPEIYLMNADGTDQTRLTNNSIVDDHPIWSPNGKKLALVSQRAGNGYSIFQMNTDGSNRVEITPLSQFVNIGPFGSVPFSMSWSPDGRKIAFQDPYYNDIWVVDVETHVRQNLTNDGGGTIGLFDHNPAWSPDGTKILFASPRYNGICSGLYLINPDGKKLRGLVPCQAYSPSWSPDGLKIVFVALNDKFASTLYIANSDGTNVLSFDGGYPDPGYRDNPRWSPDGRKIAFSLADSQDVEIYVKNIDGRSNTQLTNTPGRNYRPSWQLPNRFLSTSTSTTTDDPIFPSYDR